MAKLSWWVQTLTFFFKKLVITMLRNRIEVSKILFQVIFYQIHSDFSFKNAKAEKSYLKDIIDNLPIFHGNILEIWCTFFHVLALSVAVFTALTCDAVQRPKNISFWPQNNLNFHILKKHNRPKIKTSYTFMKVNLQCQFLCSIL